MVTQIVNTITEWVNGFTTMVLALFQNMTALFWNATDSELTLFGILALFGVGIGLVYFGLRFIRSMFPGARV